MQVGHAKCMHASVDTVGWEIFAVETFHGSMTQCIMQIFCDFIFVVRGDRENFIICTF